MKKLTYSRMAKGDLTRIGRHIAKDNPARARSFVADLRSKAAQTAARPLSFRLRDEVRPGLRSAVHRRYIIFFRDLEDEVRIIRVAHGAQDLLTLDYD